MSIGTQRLLLPFIFLGWICLVSLGAFAGRSPELRQVSPEPRPNPWKGATVAAPSQADSISSSVRSISVKEATDSGKDADGILPQEEGGHVGQSTERSMWQSWMGWAVFLGALLGFGWLGKRYPYSRDVPSVKLHFRRMRKPSRKSRRPKNLQGIPEIVSVSLGILVLVVGFSAGILLCNLILGTIWVGFGLATLAVTLPFLLLAITFLILALTGLAEIEDMMRGRSTFERGLGGIGAGCAVILFLVFVVPAAVLVGGFLTWLGLTLFVGTVGFDLALGLFLIMAALVVPAWLLSEDFFDV